MASLTVLVEVTAVIVTFCFTVAFALANFTLLSVGAAVTVMDAFFAAVA